MYPNDDGASNESDQPPSVLSSTHSVENAEASSSRNSNESADFIVDNPEDSTQQESDRRPPAIRSSLNESRAIFLPQDDNSIPQRQRMVLILPNSGRGELVARSGGPSENYMPKTYKRLLCYAEEPNVGRGYIKEQAFSPDGRLIASPFGFGIRFLAFSDDFKELCDCDTANLHLLPKKLSETGTNVSHRNNVLCTRFSPTHLLLATGCLSGKVAFHQPVL